MGNTSVFAVCSFLIVSTMCCNYNSEFLKEPAPAEFSKTLQLLPEKPQRLKDFLISCGENIKLTSDKMVIITKPDTAKTINLEVIVHNENDYSILIDNNISNFIIFGHYHNLEFKDVGITSGMFHAGRFDERYVAYFEHTPTYGVVKPRDALCVTLPMPTIKEIVGRKPEESININRAILYYYTFEYIPPWHWYDKKIDMEQKLIDTYSSDKEHPFSKPIISPENQIKVVLILYKEGVAELLGKIISSLQDVSIKKQILNEISKSDIITPEGKRIIAKQNER